MPVSKLAPITAEKKAVLDEMRRLYEDEMMTLKQVGKVYGITRQAVHNRFVAAGIPRRGNYGQRLFEYTEQHRERMTRLLIVHGDEILRLYVDDRLSPDKIGKRLGISVPRIRKFLVESGVEIRGSGPLTKFPELGKLKVGESILLPKPTRKNSPHLTYYRMAKTLKIRVSLESVNGWTFRVTRIN